MVAPYKAADYGIEPICEGVVCAANATTDLQAQGGGTAAIGDWIHTLTVVCTSATNTLNLKDGSTDVLVFTNLPVGVYNIRLDVGCKGVGWHVVTTGTATAYATGHFS